MKYPLRLAALAATLTLTISLVSPAGAGAIVQKAPADPPAADPPKPDLPKPVPDAIVNAKLGPVPLFGAIDDKGAPLTAKAEGATRPSIPVFVHPDDARAFFDLMRQKRPDVLGKMHVAPISLADIYRYQMANQAKPDTPLFEIVPNAGELEAARALLSAERRKNFRGTPVFMLRLGSSANYPTVKQPDGHEVAPIFFSRLEAEMLMDKLKEQRPEFRESLHVEVLVLDGVLSTLGAPQMTLVVLVPHRAGIAFVRDLQAKAGAPKPAAPKPGDPKPATPKPTAPRPPATKPASVKPGGR